MWGECRPKRKHTFKVLILTNVISPYRVSLFNALVSAPKEADWSYRVVFLAERDEIRGWNVPKENIKFNYQVLHGWHKFIWSREIPIHLNRGFIRMLREYNPDVIVTTGYNQPVYWQAFLYCKLFGKKFILHNGTTLLSARTVKGLRGILKRIIIRGADSCIAYGSKAREYMEYMGAESERIQASINTVDMEYFRNSVFDYRLPEGFAVERSKYPGFLLLYVGQLIERKGVIQVLRALDFLKDPDVGLIVVGDGPQEEGLKEFCRRKNLRNVFFEGFKQQEDLLRYYALADVLIMPSFEDIWGVVVNEALASGLFVLSSKYVGAAFDVIEGGVNGRVFNPENIREIAEIIKETKGDSGIIRSRRYEISEKSCIKLDISKSAEVFQRVLSKFHKASKESGKDSGV